MDVLKDAFNQTDWNKLFHEAEKNGFNEDELNKLRNVYKEKNKATDDEKARFIDYLVNMDNVIIYDDQNKSFTQFVTAKKEKKESLLWWLLRWGCAACGVLWLSTKFQPTLF